MRVSSPLRHLLTRHRWTYWLIVAGLGAAVLMMALEPGRRAEIERSRWGASAPVLVVTSAVTAGSPLEGVEVRSYPLAVLPDGYLGPEALLGPTPVARRPLEPGRVVTSHDVSAAGTVAALARPGDVVTAVRPAVHPALEPGDRVAVTSEGIELVDDAVVVEVRPTEVILAVPAASGPLVAAADTGLGGVSLLLIP